eukprot:3366139-Amphidinium_carterae.3
MPPSDHQHECTLEQCRQTRPSRFKRDHDKWASRGQSEYHKAVAMQLRNFNTGQSVLAQTP